MPWNNSYAKISAKPRIWQGEINVASYRYIAAECQVTLKLFLIFFVINNLVNLAVICEKKDNGLETRKVKTDRGQQGIFVDDTRSYTSSPRLVFGWPPFVRTVLGQVVWGTGKMGLGPFSFLFLAFNKRELCELLIFSKGQTFSMKWSILILIIFQKILYNFVFFIVQSS